MLCQDGCVDCEPCVAQRNPSFKWVLQRVKRLPTSDPPRHDLQLTIMPQADGHFHASNLWPNSYVYVTSPEEREASFVVKTHQDDDPNSSASLENSFSRQHHRSMSPWRLTERDSVAAQHEIPRQDDRVQVNASTVREESPGQVAGLGNTRRAHGPKPATNSPADVALNEETNQSAPELILGIDQQGRKHLIHVVPMDPISAHQPPSPSVPNRPSRYAAGQTAHSNKTIPGRDGQTYRRIFRRVFDSLNTHRRSIENFFGSPVNNVNGRGISPSGDNTEVGGFFRNNRDVGRTSVDPEARFDGTSSSSSHAVDDDRVKMYQGYGKRRGYEDTKQVSDHYYSRYRDENVAKMLHSERSRHSRRMTNLDRGRDRRRIRIEPHDGTRQNTPARNLSISPPSSDDFAAVAIPKPGPGNGLVTNSAKQIDLNDTSAGRTSAHSGNDDSIQSSSITTNRKSRQLFTSGSLASGNANRDFEVLRHPFRIIVTTESPVIRRERGTLNRTDTLRIATSTTH